MKWFLYGKSEGAILVRTLVEVLLGWFGANLGEIFDLFHLEDGVKGLVMGAVTVIITALLSWIRKAKGEETCE